MTSEPKRSEALRAIVEPVCAAHGLSLVDARFVTDHGAVLRVLIERPEAGSGSGVTLEDCQSVSRDLSVALDVEDAPTPGSSYRLEVSSPGLERPLLRRADYERFAGREVKIKTFKPHHGRRTFTGILLGLRGQDPQTPGNAQTHTEASEQIGVRMDGEELAIPLADIAKANLVFRF
ncbi:MAG: ribosome maturation factor RimP [Myxococcales bacterium]|nr:ribosome maturation factor RimP [Myxococcales bacterium]